METDDTPSIPLQITFPDGPNSPDPWALAIRMANLTRSIASLMLGMLLVQFVQLLIGNPSAPMLIRCMLFGWVFAMVAQAFLCWLRYPSRQLWAEHAVYRAEQAELIDEAQAIARATKLPIAIFQIQEGHRFFGPRVGDYRLGVLKTLRWANVAFVNGTIHNSIVLPADVVELHHYREEGEANISFPEMVYGLNGQAYLAGRVVIELYGIVDDDEDDGPKAPKKELEVTTNDRKWWWWLQPPPKLRPTSVGVG